MFKHPKLNSPTKSFSLGMGSRTLAHQIELSMPAKYIIYTFRLNSSPVEKVKHNNAIDFGDKNRMFSQEKGINK